ncbi:hypothetical protein [Chamaesiphon sp.]|uniref:hypothetical protein n=1 Tax=Chamaesiphon sp. TaxID=2814140 RepID=UPI0035930504
MKLAKLFDLILVLFIRRLTQFHIRLAFEIYISKQTSSVLNLEELFGQDSISVESNEALDRVEDRRNLVEVAKVSTSSLTADI